MATIPFNTSPSSPKPARPRSIARLGAWGATALAALSLLGIVMTSDRGSTRLGAILGGAASAPPVQTAAIAPPQPLPDPAVARLTEQVHSLATQRDRLTQRVATLEQTLTDITASIRQPAAPARAPTGPVQAATPPAVPPPMPAPAQSTAVPAPSSVASLSTNPAAVTASPPPAETPARSLPVAEPSATAEPPVPLPPTRTAALPAEDSTAPALPQPVPDVKAEHGIDLGGAPSQEKLSAHWIAVKNAYGPLIAGVRPMVRVRERRPGEFEFRLILGPLPTAGAAAALCAHLSAVRPTYCRATQYSPVRAATR